MKALVPALVSLVLLSGCGAPKPLTAADPSSTVVFIGDSITFNWNLAQQFPNNPHWINKGIPGQKAPQIEARFQQDAIALHPDAIVLLAGTNDILFHDPIEQPLQAVTNMVSAAQAAHIPVVLCLIPPVDGDINGLIYDPVTVVDYNSQLQLIGLGDGVQVANYYKVIAGPDGFPLSGMLLDGIHPTQQTYTRLDPLVMQSLGALR